MIENILKALCQSNSNFVITNIIFIDCMISVLYLPNASMHQHEYSSQTLVSSTPSGIGSHRGTTTFSFCFISFFVCFCKRQSGKIRQSILLAWSLCVFSIYSPKLFTHQQVSVAASHCS